jgi:hypothetical protein
MSKRYWPIIGAACLWFLLVCCGCDVGDILSSGIPGLDSLVAGDNGTDNASGPDGSAPGKVPGDCTLTLRTDGQGTVRMDPPGGAYPKNSTVTLYAESAAGWQFRKWLTAESNVEVWFQIIWSPAAVVMNRDKIVVAVFEPISSSAAPTPTPVPTSGIFTLTINTVGDGYVTTNPYVPSGTVPAFASGTTVTLNAYPNPGCRFDRWEGDLTGSAGIAALIMDVPKTVTAFFMPTPTATPTPTPTPPPALTPVTAPVILPDNTTVYLYSVNFSITCGTPGAAIYFTKDGSDPLTGGILYDAADNTTHWVGHCTWVKAVARLAGMADSPVSAVFFTVNPDQPLVDNVTVSGLPYAGTTTTVTVSCDAIDFDGAVTGVTVNLSSLYGSSSESLTNTSGNHWSWSGNVTPLTSGSKTVSITATGSDNVTGMGYGFITVSP